MNKSASLYHVLSCLVLCLIFGATSFLTVELEDIKYVVAFIAILIVLFGFVPVYNQNINQISVLQWQNKVFFFAAVAFAVYIITNWYVLGSPYFGIRTMVYYWLCLHAFMISVFVLREQSNIKILLYAMVLISIAGALYAVAEYLAYIPYCEPQAWPPRVTGLFAHKNPFALFVAISSIWSWYAILLSRKFFYRLAAALLLVLQYIGLYISDARGGLVFGVLAGVLFVGVWFLKTEKRLQLNWRLLVYGMLLVTGSTVIVILPEYFWMRMAHLMRPDVEFIRPLLYKAEWAMVHAKPVFGWGVGNFVVSNRPFWPEKLINSLSAFWFPRNAESEYFEIITELGIVGLCFFMFFFIGSLVLAVRSLRKTWDWKQYGLLLTLVILGLNGIYDTALRRLPLAIVFWAVMGYFWSPMIKNVWNIKTKKIAALSSIVIGVITIILFALYARLLAADYLFKQSYRTSEKLNPQLGNNLLKALAICPFHPDALYQSAYVAVQFQQWAYVLNAANYLEVTSPHYRPTLFLKAVVAYRTDKLDSALVFVRQELHRNPNFIEARELEFVILARLHDVQTLDSLKKTMGITRLTPLALDTVVTTLSDSALKDRYMHEVNTGGLRRLLGGTYLKTAYKRYTENMLQIQVGNMARLVAMARMGNEQKQGGVAQESSKNADKQ